MFVATKFTCKGLHEQRHDRAICQSVVSLEIYIQKHIQRIYDEREFTLYAPCFPPKRQGKMTSCFIALSRTACATTTKRCPTYNRRTGTATQPRMLIFFVALSSTKRALLHRYATTDVLFQRSTMVLSPSSIYTIYIHAMSARVVSRARYSTPSRSTKTENRRQANRVLAPIRNLSSLLGTFGSSVHNRRRPPTTTTTRPCVVHSTIKSSILKQVLYHSNKKVTLLLGQQHIKCALASLS